MPFSRLFGLAAQKRRGKFFFRAGNQKSTSVHFEIPFRRRIARPDRWSIRIQSTPIVCSSLMCIDTKCGRYCPGTGLMRIVWGLSAAPGRPARIGCQASRCFTRRFSLFLYFFLISIASYILTISVVFFNPFHLLNGFFVLLSASPFSIPLPSVYCGFLLTNLSDSVVFQ